MLTRQFLISHPAHLIALGFGSGLSRIAPGTVGTLWAWASFLVLQIWLSPFEMGVLIAASLFVGWWACTLTARHMGVADPGAIVWDEVVAFWLVLWMVTPTTFWGQLAAFAMTQLGALRASLKAEGEAQFDILQPDAPMPVAPLPSMARRCWSKKGVYNARKCGELGQAN
mgnify:CR=1 FL=1